MKKFTGVIKRLGNAVTTAGAHQYSVVEIGDDLIQNKFASNGLVNYLEQAVESQETVSLWVHSQYIVAVKLANEKTYAVKFKNSWQTIVMLVCSIPLMVFLVGFIIAAFALGKIFAAARYNSKIATISETNMTMLEAVA